MKEIIALSPMDGITDLPFRLMVEQFSPMINTVYTEFVNVQGLYEKPDLHVKRLLYRPEEPKIFAQFFGNGSQLKYFEIAAFIAKQMGFDGIDLNLGCPEKRVVQSGAGSALIGNEKTVKSIISAIRTGLKSDYSTDSKVKKILAEVNKTRAAGFLRPQKKTLTISIKTRLGIKEVMPDTWWKFLDTLKVDLITIHGRTQSQMYSGSANWKHIQKINKLMQTPILGNGDIGKAFFTDENYNAQNELSSKLKITPEGILIGRGFLGNVDLLSRHKVTRTLKGQLSFIKKHIELYKAFAPEYIDPLKKHIVWYLKGLPDVKDLKQKFMECETYEDCDTILSQV
ncbi:tRNA-dihydrouridine synthase family protein [Candidatus Dojkabacteria bacterium]|nr:tRNA-dihydrouridine synthase family protein [Candidatus Dojkabacteria bacterium]